MKSNWEKVRLNELITIKHGFAFKGQYFVNDPTSDVLVTPGNFFIGGGFDISKRKYYSGPIDDEYVLKADDLIVTMTDLSKNGDTLGYSAKVPKGDNVRYLHNQRIGLINLVHSSVCKDFLYWLLRSRHYHTFIVNSSTGTTVKHTSPSRIGEYQFFLPSFPEQEKIANILSSFEEKIEINKKIIDTLDDCCTAYFNNKFSNLPKTKELKSFCSIVMGQSPKGSSLNADGDGYVFYQGCTDFGKHFPTRRLYTTNPKKLANKGDILVSVRAPVGRINIANETCCIGRGLASIKSSYPTFCLFALYASNEEFAKYEADGTVFGSINKKGLEGINIFNADETAMSEFEQFSSPYVEMISDLDMENRLLANIRNTLLPKLLSGEIELKI